MNKYALYERIKQKSHGRQNLPKNMKRELKR